VPEAGVSEVRRIETSLASVMTQLQAMSDEIKELSSKQLSSSRALQEDARAAQARLEAQLHLLQQSSGAGYTSLAVAAQALVLAAFLFYQRFYKRQRDHFL